MDFTELFPSSLPPVFSPGSTFLASTSSTASSQTILVRHATTLQTLQTFRIPSLPPAYSPSPSLTLTSSSRSRRPTAEATPTPTPPPEITHLSFSPDSARVLAFCSKRAVAFVFTLGGVGDLGGADDEAVEAFLEGGVEGLVRVEWSRTGNKLIGWSELGLRLTIWDLDDPERDRRFYIQNFKPLPSGHGHTWSSDNRFFYLAERHTSKDSVAIYDTLDSWKLVHRVPTHTTSLHGISLSPRNTHLVAWDYSLEYKLQILLPPLLRPLQTFPPPPTPAKRESLGENPVGEEWDDTGLGVRCVAWHPGGARVAVGGWDGKIRILDDKSWDLLSTIEPMRLAPAGTSVWKEPGDWIKESGGVGIFQYHSISTPATIPFLRPDPKRPPPKMGVCQLEFNFDGTLLMCRQENSPSSLFLHPFPPHPSTPPTVLIQASPILSASFHPTNPKKLALSTASNGVYFWNGDWVDEAGREGVAECVGVPSSPFNVSSVTWSPDGEGLCLMDSSGGKGIEGQFALVFEAKDDDQDEPGPYEGGEDSFGEVPDEEGGMSLIHEGEEEDELSLGDLTGFSA